MNLYLISVFLLLMSTWLAVCSRSPSHFTSDVSINCGSSATSTTRDGREWHGDVPPKLPPFVQIKGSSTSSTALSGDDLLPPYSTARLSRSQFSYALRVSPGQKILRLHFNSSPYRGYKSFKDLFAVDAGSFTLLSNFSASLTARALGVSSFVKEYCLNLQENQLFEIVLSPASSQLSDAFALINGIEIISLPASISYFHGPNIGLPVVGKSPVYVDYSTALEIIRRLNLKKDSVSSAANGGYMFGMWEAVPKQKTSKVKNFTWTTSVDVGFSYLVRLYFSEVQLEVTESSAVVFKVSINEMLVDTSSDVFREGENEDNFIPMYVDYMMMMRGHKQEGGRDLVISIESNVEFIDGHGSFKGFEIVKLSNLEYSLASPNPLSSAQDSPHGTLQTMHKVFGGKNMIATITIMFLALANIIIYTLTQIWGADATEPGTEEKSLLSARAHLLCRRFSLSEIQVATRNFSEAHVIGKGGFGKVYKGLIDEGQETVAIKRLKSNSRQGAREFCTEIETLIELRHVNLVSLIGYCNEQGEMIIVYEYMAHGSLSDHLYKLARKNGNCPHLNWKERVAICIGAARGLEYLHSGKLLIHRDIKASNILLDENLLAKISDFGLAKSLNRSKEESHVSTKVKGTLGYLDPNYYSTGKLTRKSDIYALGVVLLEALCGRPAVDRLTMYDEQILTKWALENISKGRVHQIVDSNIRGEILEDSLKSFVELAQRCLLDEPKKRPRMAQVVLQLEFALEQQERETSPLLKSEITSDLYPIHPNDEASNDGKLTALQRNMEVNINNEGENIDGVRKGTDNEILPAFYEINLSASTGQGMTELQKVTPPHEGQTNSKIPGIELPSNSKGGRKSATNKPSLFTSLDAFWNRFKPSSKIKPSLSSDHAVETETVQKSNQSVDMHPISVPAIPLYEMKKITGNFSSMCVIGNGYRGTVFRAVLEKGQAAVIKTFEYIEQEQEFALVSVLSNLKHENVVRLLGYCMDENENKVILAYEFAPHGSLDDILHGRARSSLRPVLSWTQRVKISIGAAKGLEYIHGEAQMHRNIKSSNILLFGDYDAAKITDLRQSRPAADVTECFSAVAGTLGYHAPEYITIGELSWRSDVYNFGVVLMELLTGHRPFDRSLPKPKQHLVQWVTSNLPKRKVIRVVDARLEGRYPVKAAVKMAEIAAKCVEAKPDSRPTMSAVVKSLQSLLGGRG